MRDDDDDWSLEPKLTNKWPLWCSRITCRLFDTHPSITYTIRWGSHDLTNSQKHDHCLPCRCPFWLFWSHFKENREPKTIILLLDRKFMFFGMTDNFHLFIP
eukprot:sb/3478404/